MMFDIVMYFLESMIVGYFIYRFFDKRVVITDLIIFVLAYLITNITTSYFLAYNYIFSLISTLYIYLLISSINVEMSKYNCLLIAILFQVILSFCSGLSLTRFVNIILGIENQAGVTYNVIYILSSIFSRGILLSLLCYLCCRYFTYYKSLDKEYCLIIALYLLISLLVCYYICNSMFFWNLSKVNMLMILISCFFNVFFVGVLVTYINRDLENKRLQELEIQKLKFIEDNYIFLKSQKERNESIKHDLEYFMDLVKQKNKEQEISLLLENTLDKLEKEEILIYSSNKVINNLFVQFKEIGIKYNQTIHYNINITDKEITIHQYDKLITFFEEICQNNNADTLQITITSLDNFMTFEFIIETNDDVCMSYENVIVKKIDDHASIKYILEY